MKNIIIYNISQVIIMCLPFTSLKKTSLEASLHDFVRHSSCGPWRLRRLRRRSRCWRRSHGALDFFQISIWKMWDFGSLLWCGGDGFFLMFFFFVFFFQMVVQWWTGWILKPTWGCGTGKLRRTKGRERPCQLKVLYGAALSSSFSLVQEQ